MDILILPLFLSLALNILLSAEMKRLEKIIKTGEKLTRMEWL